MIDSASTVMQQYWECGENRCSLNKMNEHSPGEIFEFQFTPENITSFCKVDNKIALFPVTLDSVIHEVNMSFNRPIGSEASGQFGLYLKCENDQFYSIDAGLIMPGPQLENMSQNLASNNITKEFVWRVKTPMTIRELLVLSKGEEYVINLVENLKEMTVYTPLFIGYFANMPFFSDIQSGSFIAKLTGSNFPDLPKEAMMKKTTKLATLLGIMAIDSTVAMDVSNMQADTSNNTVPPLEHRLSARRRFAESSNPYGQRIRVLLQIEDSYPVCQADSATLASLEYTNKEKLQEAIAGFQNATEESFNLVLYELLKQFYQLEVKNNELKRFYETEGMFASDGGKPPLGSRLTCRPEPELALCKTQITIVEGLLNGIIEKIFQSEFFKNFRTPLIEGVALAELQHPIQQKAIVLLLARVSGPDFLSFEVRRGLWHLYDLEEIKCELTALSDKNSYNLYQRILEAIDWIRRHGKLYLAFKSLDNQSVI